MTICRVKIRNQYKINGIDRINEIPSRRRVILRLLLIRLDTYIEYRVYKSKAICK